MEIVPVTIDDLAEIAKLHAHFWGEVSDAEKMCETLARLDADPNYSVLCARVNGRAVGTATGVVCRGLYGGSDSYLVVEDVVVDPNHRREGIASALLAALEFFARECDCSQILLLTEASREDAVGFYESAGFDGATYQGFKKRLKRQPEAGRL